MQQEPPEVGRWREPVIPAHPTTFQEVSWARSRPPGQRAAKPSVGDVVGLRLQMHGPIVRARILSVSDERPEDTRPGAEIDLNVWRYVVKDPVKGPLEHPLKPGHRLVELVDDPWWNVLLETVEGPKIRVEAREARLSGAAGWLAER